jgi:hypothetical protein
MARKAGFLFLFLSRRILEMIEEREGGRGLE